MENQERREERGARAVLVLIGALTAVLAMGWSQIGTAPRHPDAAIPGIVLLALFIGFERKEIRIRIGSQGHDFTLTEIPVVLGLFLVAAPVLLAVRVISSVIVRIARRQAPIKVAFNTALGVHDVLIPALCLRWLGEQSGGFGPRTWVALLIGASSAAVSSGALVTVVIWLVSGKRASVREMVGPSGLISLCSASVGLLLVNFLIDDPVEVALLVVPLLGLVAGYAAFERQVRERRRLEFLYRCTGAVSRARSTDEAARAVLAECCDDLRASSAELIVFSVDDGTFRTRACQDETLRVELEVPEEVETALRAVVSATADTAIIDVENDGGNSMGGWRSTLLRRTRDEPVVAPVLLAYLAARGHSRVMVSPLTSGEAPFGILIVGDRHPGTGAFGPEEVPVLRTLTDQISGTFASDALYDAVETLRKLQAELAHQAGHDQLTSLPNRRRFMESVHETLEGRRENDAATSAILFIDLDDFKLANDTYGHAAGDALLVAVGERITTSVREGDVAARLGGDEFAVLLVGADSERAGIIAARILESFQLPVFHDGHEVMPAGSIGAAVVTRGTDVEEALRRADQAMYTAKQRGKGSFVDYGSLAVDH